MGIIFVAFLFMFVFFGVGSVIVQMAEGIKEGIKDGNARFERDERRKAENS